MQIYQDTYCKGHIHTEPPGICTSQGKGLETHQGQPQQHIGSDYCIWNEKKKKGGGQKTAWHNFWHSIKRREDAGTESSASAWEAAQGNTHRLMVNTDAHISLLPLLFRLPFSCMLTKFQLIHTRRITLCLCKKCALI